MNEQESSLEDPFPSPSPIGARIIEPGEGSQEIPNRPQLFDCLCRVRVLHGSLGLGHLHGKNNLGIKDKSVYLGAQVAGHLAVVELPYAEVVELLTRWLSVAYEQSVPQPDASPETNPGTRILKRLMPAGKLDAPLELTDDPMNEPFKVDVAQRIAAKRADALKLNGGGMMAQLIPQ